MKPRQIYFFSASDPDHSPHGTMAAFYLAGQGCAVEGIAPGPRGRSEFSNVLGQIKFKSLVVRRGWLGSVSLQWQFFREILVRRWRSKSSLFYLSGSVVAPAACLALTGLARGRVVYHTHDFLEPGRHPVWGFFEGRLARRAGRVICNEANRARCLASLYRLRELPTVVRTALPKKWPSPPLDSDLRRALIDQTGYAGKIQPVLVMHAGAFSPVRCTGPLLAALSRLPDNYLLVMTGIEPETADCKAAWRRVEDLWLQHRIALLPRLSFAELLRHLACGDVGLLLYPNDGIGNYYQAPGRLTEYLGAGLPVVASHFPGLTALIERHALGRTCDPESPVKIAHAIEQVGRITGRQRETERDRLRVLARTDLAYETEAVHLAELFSPQAATPRTLPTNLISPTPCHRPA